MQDQPRQICSGSFALMSRYVQKVRERVGEQVSEKTSELIGVNVASEVELKPLN